MCVILGEVLCGCENHNGNTMLNEVCMCNLNGIILISASDPAQCTGLQL